MASSNWNKVYFTEIGHQRQNRSLLPVNLMNGRKNNISIFKIIYIDAHRKGKTGKLL